MSDTANKDEALKCLSIAQRHFDSQNYSAAQKWIKKSISLYSTPEAQKLSTIINNEANSSSTSNSSTKPDTKASGVNVHAEENQPRHRHATSGTANGSATAKEKRDYTPDQMEVVKRVRKYKVTEYYEILGLKKDCDEVDVKKAYRKLALQLHPDKNGAPGADEAFKMVSKAFQVLSDSSLRAAFDSHGGDPESRASGPTASPFRHARGGGGGMHFDGEISPEELFNMFFGGGGGGFNGGGFGGPGVSFSFGPGGFTTLNTGPRRRQAHPQQQAQAAPASSFRQLIPILLFLLMTFGGPILNLLSSLIFEQPPPDPAFTWQQTPARSTLRTTTADSRYGLKGGVGYWVNGKEWDTHPWIINAVAGTGTPTEVLKFEKGVEGAWLSRQYDLCVKTLRYREAKIDNMKGLFGIGADWEAIEKLRAEPIESCHEVVTKWGISVQGYVRPRN